MQLRDYLTEHGADFCTRPLCEETNESEKGDLDYEHPQEDGIYNR